MVYTSVEGLSSIRSDGSHRSLLVAGEAANGPAWSPNGRYIAYFEDGLSIVAADGSGLRSYSVSGFDEWPSWSPDGRRIAYTSTWKLDDAADLYAVAVRADGVVVAEDVVQLTRTPTLSESDPAWSPDGRRIAFVRYDEAGESEGILVLDLRTRRLRRLTSGSAPDWSPNGSKLVFVAATRTGSVIAVINADGSGERRIISPREDLNSPAWSPDGARIAYATLPRDWTGDWQQARLFIARADGTRARLFVRGGAQADWRPHSP